MTDLLLIGRDDMSAQGGGSSPDPVTPGTPSWTWDVNLGTSPNQWVVGKTTLCMLSSIGGGTHWMFSGVVDYVTRDASGAETDHPVYQSSPDGCADYVADYGIDRITFGCGCEGDNVFTARMTYEVWAT